MISRLPKKPPTFVSVTCGTCHALLHPVLKEEMRFVKCPDCYLPVKVPSRAQVMALLPPTKPEKNVGTYGVAEFGSDTSEQRRKDLNTTPVHCPVCDARLHPKMKQQARKVRCPDCDSAVPVPAASEVKQKRQEEKLRKQRREEKRKPGHHALVTSTIDWDDVYTPKTDLFEVLGAIKSVELPNPPTWTFFSGVFNILWRSEIVFRWLRLSMLFAITFLFLMMTVTFVGSGGMGTVAAGFFGIPVFWLGLWSLSYAMIIFQTILIDTANGNDRILEWPDPEWKIYAYRCYQMLFVTLASGTLSWFLTNIVRYFLPSFGFWTIFSVFFLALTPVMIVSAEESGSHWNFFTARILKTLISCWWGWGIVYSSLAVMWGLSLGILFTAVAKSAGFHIYLLAAVLIPVCVIYSGRIMGRLLWRAIVVPSQLIEVVEKPVLEESLHPEEHAKSSSKLR